MLVSIIGAGALGKLYGGLLARSGHEVHYLLKSEYETIHKQQFFDIHFQESDETYHITKPNIVTDPKALPQADLVIITVKTTENPSLQSLLSSTLKPDSTVLIIQNGIGNEAWIQQYCSSQTIISAISTAAVTRKENALVDVYFLGELRIAAYGQQNEASCQMIASLFKSDIQPKVVVYQNYQLMRWQKLIWNVPFGALSIIYDQSCDVLASRTPFILMVEGIMAEIQAIAASTGAEIQDEYIRKTIETTRKVEGYYPSMYWDFKQHRPIEKQFIIDNVLSIAQENDVKTPLLTLIKANLENILEG